MGLPFTDNGSLYIKDPVIPFFHALDDHSDPMGDLVGHETQRLLPDQLRSDLAHGLVCDRILVIILGALRQILEQGADQGIGVGLSHGRYGDDLLKPVHILIGVHGLYDLILFYGIDLIDHQDHRRFHLVQHL